MKICGITSVDDGLLAAALGADAVGLVFAASSRRITSGRARDIVRRLPPEVLSVGVFRNERKERVVEVANTIGLRTVQLHGHETPVETRWIAERVPAVIRAFSAGDPALERVEDYGDIQVLIDSAEPGSGKAFNWSTLDASSIGRPIVLAGGLSPDNVAQAIATVKPWGVDVSSGVEARPGVKDPVKVQRFLAIAKNLGDEQSDSAVETPDKDSRTASTGAESAGTESEGTESAGPASDSLTA